MIKFHGTIANHDTTLAVHHKRRASQTKALKQNNTGKHDRMTTLLAPRLFPARRDAVRADALW
jgi:hypothetical protein